MEVSHFDPFYLQFLPNYFLFFHWPSLLQHPPLCLHILAFPWLGVVKKINPFLLRVADLTLEPKWKTWGLEFTPNSTQGSKRNWWFDWMGSDSSHLCSDLITAFCSFFSQYLWTMLIFKISYIAIIIWYHSGFKCKFQFLPIYSLSLLPVLMSQA